MGGPVILGSSQNGNKNIMWGKLLANEGRSTWIHHVGFKHLKWPCCFFRLRKKNKPRPKRPLIFSIGFQGFSRSEVVRRSVSNQVDWWIWPALFRFPGPLLRFGGHFYGNSGPSPQGTMTAPWLATDWNPQLSGFERARLISILAHSGRGGFFFGFFTAVGLKEIVKHREKA